MDVELYRDLNIKPDIWMCRAGGNGELESVDHGRSRDSRSCLSRRQGQIFSARAKDWPLNRVCWKARRMRAGS